MAGRLSILLLTLQITACSDDAETFKKENITGTWVVTEVDHDGVALPEWTGIDLIFEQHEMGAGRYTMSETKNDSIWSSEGRWQKMTDFSLLLNDTLAINYDCDGTFLRIEMHLPWTGKNPCNEFICTPIVTGNWSFKFARKN